MATIAEEKEREKRKSNKKKLRLTVHSQPQLGLFQFLKRASEDRGVQPSIQDYISGLCPTQEVEPTVFDGQLRGTNLL